MSYTWASLAGMKWADCVFTWAAGPTPVVYHNTTATAGPLHGHTVSSTQRGHVVSASMHGHSVSAKGPHT